MKNSRKIILIPVISIPIFLVSMIIKSEPEITEEGAMLKVILMWTSILVGIIFAKYINDKVWKENSDISNMFNL